MLRIGTNKIKTPDGRIHSFQSEERLIKFESEMKDLSKKLINIGVYIECSFCKAAIPNLGKQKSKCPFCGSIT